LPHNGFGKIGKNNIPVVCATRRLPAPFPFEGALMRRLELRETAGVSARGSQPRSGTARGSARQHHDCLPGAWLTEKRSFGNASRKARPVPKIAEAKRCETIRARQSRARQTKTWRPVALRDPRNFVGKHCRACRSKTLFEIRIRARKRNGPHSKCGPFLIRQGRSSCRPLVSAASCRKCVCATAPSSRCP
jgi:hypothetical protein